MPWLRPHSLACSRVPLVQSVDTAQIDVADRHLPASLRSPGGEEEPPPLLRVDAGAEGTVEVLVGGWLENILSQFGGESDGDSGVR